MDAAELNRLNYFAETLARRLDVPCVLIVIAGWADPVTDGAPVNVVGHVPSEDAVRTVLAAALASLDSRAGDVPKDEPGPPS